MPDLTPRPITYPSSRSLPQKPSIPYPAPSKRPSQKPQNTTHRTNPPPPQSPTPMLFSPILPNTQPPSNQQTPPTITRCPTPNLCIYRPSFLSSSTTRPPQRPSPHHHSPPNHLYLLPDPTETPPPLLPPSPHVSVGSQLPAYPKSIPLHTRSHNQEPRGFSNNIAPRCTDRIEITLGRSCVRRAYIH